MNVNSSDPVAALESGSIDPAFAVSMLRKAQDAQRLEGDAAVRLIDATAPQMIKTEDGHISVRA
jgi:hypothetical protein